MLIRSSTIHIDFSLYFKVSKEHGGVYDKQNVKEEMNPINEWLNLLQASVNQREISCNLSYKREIPKVIKVSQLLAIIPARKVTDKSGITA